MRQYFKLLLLIVFQTMIWSQSSDNLFRVGVDYKSKIKIDTLSDIEKNAVQNIIQSSFSKTVGLTKAYDWSINFSEVAQSQFEAILREQQSQEDLSECTDNSCAITLGELANAKYMIYRDLLGLGERIQIKFELINIESGENFYTVAELFRGDDILSSEAEKLFDRLMVELFNGAFSTEIPLPSNQKLITTAPTNLYPPVPQNQSLTLTHSTPLTITLKATDRDADTVQFELVNQPQHGVARLSGNNVIYNPNKNYVGEDQLVFRVTDGTYTVPGYIDLTIRNNTPEGQDKTVRVTQGDKTTFVLSLYDRDNDDLKIELISNPKKGRLRQTSLSAFRYTPLQDVSGKDSFTYRVYDGITYSKGYRVDITIVEEQVVVQQQPVVIDSDDSDDSDEGGGNNMLLIVGGLLLLVLLAGGGGGGDSGPAPTGGVDIGIDIP
jgi:hypothetical protein